MTLKIFLTGATGYIGGTALEVVQTAHPDYEFTLLVRNEERAKAVKAKYPNAKFAYASLDDVAVIEKAAAEADIVIHTADSSDHVAAAKAIAKGLATGHSADKPGYWLHTSGTNILTWYDDTNNRAGEGPLAEQKYHDIDDVDKIINFPDVADHRDVDKIVQASNSDAVRVAIVCPPTIYGSGTGPVNVTSKQVPLLARVTLEKGFAPIVGAGKTEWDNVHVEDLGDLLLKLVDATQDPSKNSNKELFGPRGYFCAEGGSHKWADVATWIAEEASKTGYLPVGLTKSVTLKEAEQVHGKSWGQNSKGVAQRARKYLGWAPGRQALKETIPEAVAVEVKQLGLTPKEKKG